MVYTLFENQQIAENCRIVEINYLEKLPDLPDAERKTIEKCLYSKK
jgi:hypothetical protein